MMDMLKTNAPPDYGHKTLFNFTIFVLLFIIVAVIHKVSVEVCSEGLCKSHVTLSYMTRSFMFKTKTYFFLLIGIFLLVVMLQKSETSISCLMLSLSTQNRADDEISSYSYSPLVHRHALTTYPVYLVVSHCKQDLFWLANLTSIFQIHDIVIYSKCGYPVIGAPPNALVSLLPNVGRCDHTYAHYISELKATEGVVLFVKDTTHVHNIQEGNMKGMNNRRSYQTMVEEASGPSQFSCRQFIDPAVGISNEAIYTYLVKYSIAKYNLSFHNYTTKQVEPFSIHRNMMSWMQGLGVTLQQPLTPVCYGGIFAVNVQRLQALDRKVWIGVRNSLSRADNIEEGHFMERSWAGLLSMEQPMSIHSNNYSLNNTAPLCFRRNICGYRGHIVRSREQIRKQRLCARVSRSKIMNAIHRCPMRQPRNSEQEVRL